MKKFLSAVLVILCVAALFAGCGGGEKTEDVLAVEAMIEALPEEITPALGVPLEEARAAFDALPEEDQARVSGRKRLEKLETAFLTFMDVRNYTQDIAAVAKGEYNKSTDFTGLLTRAEEIKNSYNKLPKDQQDQIEGIDGIDDALPIVQTYVDNAKTGAANYVSAFLKLNEKKNYNITAVYCNKQPGKDGEELHFYALTYQDDAGAEHTVYSNARFGHTVSAYILLSRPEAFFADTAPAGENDPVEYGNVKLDAAEVVAAARQLPVPEAAVTTDAGASTGAEETAEGTSAAAENTTAAAAETTTAA